MPSHSPMASLPSGPSWPISAQHPYPPVSHAILQPGISTLQPLMLSTTPASHTSSPSCLSSAIHPCCLVPRDLSQPNIPTLQSHMLSFSPASLPSAPHALSTTPASLTSSPSCLSSGIHPCCPVTHAHPQPSIPTLQSLMKCPPSAPASLPSSPLQLTSTLHSLSSATLPSGPYCPPSALHVQFKTPINQKINIL